MKKPKEYEIETLEQLVNIVTPENFERLSIDFLSWLNFVNQSFAKIKEKENLKDMLNSEIATVKFVWVDDGQNKIKGIKIKNTTTGEVTETNTK